MTSTSDFRPLRRKRQALSAEDCAEVLRRNTSGVLALAGDGGYPYAVPLSYVYVADGAAPSGGTPGDGAAIDDGAPAEPALGRIIFHSASAGHKIDAIRREPKASFCVVDQNQVVPEEFTTYFRSVIAFGRVRIIEDDAEKRAAIERLSRRYAPHAAPEAEAAEIDRFWRGLAMLELTIDHLSGKQAIELARL